MVEEGLDRPFLLLDSALGNHTSPALTDMWQHLRGWHRNFQLATAGHYSYTDVQALLPTLAAAGRLPASALADNVGTVDPCRSLRAQSAYLAAFFDLHLRHRSDHGLLDGPSADYPEMSFVA
ncbi:hypothetical protein [Kitasatospora cathayae]|uniref:Uncharacterized protein n=1 Tax=Kitasatospora cathayae TaxID=3004092 RepID=A0ABY7PYW4_9ACTN|nr:hypothetical protein [Kitasatospora sp. HUAS 3-15]WBP85434.1 hypothetical protein O1G21_05895 [Kitasatospora sp. HUAS 3-15]